MSSPPRSMRNGEAALLGVDELVGVDPRFAAPVVTNVVGRPRLHTRLDSGTAAPCVLISAPAGWGKTLLAGSWLAIAPEGSTAWVALRSVDDDLRSFWTSVVSSLLLHVGDAAGAQLSAAVAEADLEQVPGRIATAMALEEATVVLVIDNLHEITSPAVHDSLLRLLRRPARHLRLIVTTRRDPPWPLSRLRLAGMVSEIRSSDLAFRAGEAQALLDELGVQLDGVHLDQLVRRTEGWPAGLRLAALELQGAADPARFVEMFSGDDHAVSAYLFEEVIDHLAPELLDFLVRVSILDVVSANLADALTERADGAARLAELASANLFVQAVGGGRWYRLHRLIADVLRLRVGDRRTLRELHRRAVVWHLQQAMPLDAVRYALRGELWSFAAELVGVNVLAFTVEGDPREIDLLLTAVPRTVLLGHPELAAALAAARLLQASPWEVGELAAAARAGVDSLPAPRATRLQVVLDLVDMGNSRAEGDFRRVVEACRRVPSNPAELSALRLPGWDVVPLLVLSNTGVAEFWTGDTAEAEKHLRAATVTGRSGRVLRPHLNTAAHLALLQCERGELAAAHDEAQAVVQQATDAGWTVSAQVVAAYLTLARVALDRDNHTAAGEWLARVAQVEAIIPEPHVQLAAAALGALVRADGDDALGALAALQRTMSNLITDVPDALADGVAQVQAELLSRVGDLARAREVLAGVRGPATAGSMRATARLHLLAGDPSAAGRVLATIPDDGSTVRSQVEHDLLACMVTPSHDRAAALPHLDRALLAAAPVGLRRPFLVHAAELRDLLDADIQAGTAAAAFAVDLVRRMSGSDSQPPAVLVAALTDREHVVLRYLASTLSNAEMAAELYLSVNTIKSHQRMVYRKLGAEGRRDAVRRAKALRLL
jgi:LuxR family maltose regulon positive regulatory protein